MHSFLACFAEKLNFVAIYVEIYEIIEIIVFAIVIEQWLL